MSVYLIRHPRPLIEPGICYGQSDVAIAEFADDAQRIKHLLADVNISHAFSSPLQRCLQFAQALDLRNLTTDERLMELNFGDWELQPWGAIDRQQLDVWSADFCHNPPPNGESYNALAQRVTEFAQTLPPQQTTLLITHAGVIRALIASALNLALADSFRLQIDYARVSHIDLSAQPPRVTFINR